MEKTTWPFLGVTYAHSRAISHELQDPAILAAGSGRPIDLHSVEDAVASLASRHAELLNQMAKEGSSCVHRPRDLTAECNAFLREQSPNERIGLLTLYKERLQASNLSPKLPKAYLAGIGLCIRQCIEEACQELLRAQPLEQISQLKVLLGALNDLAFFEPGRAQHDTSTLAGRLLGLPPPIADLDHSLLLLCESLRDSEDSTLQALSSSLAVHALEPHQRTRPCLTLQFLGCTAKKPGEKFNSKRLHSFERALQLTRLSLKAEQPKPGDARLPPKVDWATVVQALKERGPALHIALLSLDKQVVSVIDAAHSLTLQRDLKLSERKQALKAGLLFVNARHRFVSDLCEHPPYPGQPTFQLLLSHWGDLISWRTLSRSPEFDSPHRDSLVLEDEIRQTLMSLVTTARAPEDVETLCYRLFDLGEWCQIDALPVQASLFRALQAKASERRKQAIDGTIGVLVKRSPESREAYAQWLLAESAVFTSCRNLQANLGALRPVKKDPRISEAIRDLVEAGLKGDDSQEVEAAAELYVDYLKSEPDPRLLDAFCLAHATGVLAERSLLYWVQLLKQRMSCDVEIDVGPWSTQLLSAMQRSTQSEAYFVQEGDLKALGGLVKKLRSSEPVKAWDLFWEARKHFAGLKISTESVSLLGDAVIAADSSDRLLERVEQLKHYFKSQSIAAEGTFFRSASGAITKAPAGVADRIKSLCTLFETLSIEDQADEREHLVVAVRRLVREFPLHPPTAAMELLDLLPVEDVPSVASAFLAHLAALTPSVDGFETMLSVARQYEPEGESVASLAEMARSCPKKYVTALDRVGCFRDCEALQRNMSLIEYAISHESAQDAFESAIVRGCGAKDPATAYLAMQLGLNYCARFPARFVDIGLLTGMAAGLPKSALSPDEAATLITLIVKSANESDKRLVPILCGLALKAMEMLSPAEPSREEAGVLSSLAKRNSSDANATALLRKIEKPMVTSSGGSKKKKRSKRKQKSKNAVQLLAPKGAPQPAAPEPVVQAKEFASLINSGNWEAAKRLYLSCELDTGTWVAAVGFAPLPDGASLGELGKNAQAYLLRLERLATLFGEPSETPQRAPLLKALLPSLSWNHYSLVLFSCGAERARAATALMEALLDIEERPSEEVKDAWWELELFVNNPAPRGGYTPLLYDFPTNEMRRYLLASICFSLKADDMTSAGMGHARLYQALNRTLISADDARPILIRLYKCFLEGVCKKSSQEELTEALSTLETWREIEIGHVNSRSYHKELDSEELRLLKSITRGYVLGLLPCDQFARAAELTQVLETLLETEDSETMSGLRKDVVTRAARALNDRARKMGHHTEKLRNLLELMIRTDSGGSPGYMWLRDEFVTSCKDSPSSPQIGMARLLTAAIPKKRRDEGDLCQMHLTILESIRDLHTANPQEYNNWYCDLSGQLRALVQGESGDELYQAWMVYFAAEAGRAQIHEPVSAFLEQLLVGRRLNDHATFELEQLAELYQTMGSSAPDATLGRVLGRLSFYRPNPVDSKHFIEDATHLELIEQIRTIQEPLGKGEQMPQGLSTPLVYGVLERSLYPMWNACRVLEMNKSDAAASHVANEIASLDQGLMAIIKSEELVQLAATERTLSRMMSSMIALNGMIHCRLVKGNTEITHLNVARNRYGLVSEARDNTIDIPGIHVLQLHALLVDGLLRLDDEKLANCGAFLCWLMKDAYEKQLYGTLNHKTFYTLFEKVFSKTLQKGPHAPEKILPPLWQLMSKAIPLSKHEIIKACQPKVMQFLMDHPATPLHHLLTKLLLAQEF